ncbi:MAG TPA: YceI family protein, partial [Myxococcaceae bacterium]|nr:YceI family protein [Myxococcaceae bacterium]
MSAGWTLALVATAALAAEPEVYTVDRAQAELRFVLDAPLDSIVGISPALLGSIRYDPQSGSGNGKLIADLSTFRTGISLRDDDLRNEFFQTVKFPSATLNLQRIERKKAAPGPGEWETSEAIGTLALHGMERVVRIPVKIRYVDLVDHPVIQAVGTFSVRLADYQIQRPTALFLKLGDTAKVEVKVTLDGPHHPPPAKGEETATAVLPPLFVRTSFVPVAKPAAKKPTRPKSRFAPS